MIRAAVISSLIFIAQFAQAQLVPQEEPLMGSFVSRHGVHIQVRSGGCTEKNDFRFEKQVIEGRHVLSFHRLRPDLCLALFPYGKILTFTFEELGLLHNDLYSIRNPQPGIRVFDDTFPR